MAASRIFALARTMRWAMVASGTTKARAISGVERPPSRRSVSATRAAGASAGWQHVKIRRRRSSGTADSSSIVVGRDEQRGGLRLAVLHGTPPAGGGRGSGAGPW